MDKTPSPDMLAFPYQINKIVRDMKRVPMPDEDAESKRNIIIAMLQEVCQRIDDGFE
ncbi:hypothetical protein LJC49_11305 [Ruminococcaceae bacterium OttesenSCG-928-I18]|nr:hypothetical protein [Ruminococcaceae bacterium OttesenSCG-928-I18]